MQSAAVSLMPRKLPGPRLAYTNRVYVSCDDFVKLSVQPQEGPHFIQIKDCVFQLEAHNEVELGSISMSDLQRRFARVGLFQAVDCQQFSTAPGFDLATIVVEVAMLQPTAEKRPSNPLEILHESLESTFAGMFREQVLANRQELVIEYEGFTLKLNVCEVKLVDVGQDGADHAGTAGLIGTQTKIRFRLAASAIGRLEILGGATQQQTIFSPDFNFEELGVGGLTKEFADIFRRAFAPRCLPAHIVRHMDLVHVRGMLLYGPPGCGKTLIARQLAKFLKCAEPKIVNGPELLNKFVGQSEENVRQLFADAEREQAEKGDASQLHVIILDEMDAICKRRGSSGDGTGTTDNVVNQLLAKIDGVNGLQNVLLIGMTNRKDMIDPALLRPGRLELQVEITLPDEAGRAQILDIHTAKMRTHGYLNDDVSIREIASRTKNYSGAELAGVVRAAQSLAVGRKVDVRDPNSSKASDAEGIAVTAADFQHALVDVKPSFGCDDDRLDKCITHGITAYSPQFDRVLHKCSGFIDQVQNSKNTRLFTALLAGDVGCGKTALAAHIARLSAYPFVRRISSEEYVGCSEQQKVARIAGVFDDAGKSPLSLIILDDIERLLDYVSIGPRFSNVVLQALFTLLRQRPVREDHRMLVIGTTSELSFMGQTGLLRAFTAALTMPTVQTGHGFRAVLEELPGYSTDVLDAICNDLHGYNLGVRIVLDVAEMALQESNPVQKEVFMDCLRDTTAFDESSYDFTK